MVPFLGSTKSILRFLKGNSKKGTTEEPLGMARLEECHPIAHRAKPTMLQVRGISELEFLDLYGSLGSGHSGDEFFNQVRFDPTRF